MTAVTESDRGASEMLSPNAIYVRDLGTMREASVPFPSTCWIACNRVHETLPKTAVGRDPSFVFI
jgi:hypothetical protein